MPAQSRPCLTMVACACSGQYNDLATLFLANPDQTIKHLFSLGSLSRQQQVCKGENCYFTLRSLSLLAPVYLGLMSLAASLAIPGGLFMPSIIVRPPAAPAIHHGPPTTCLPVHTAMPGLLQLGTSAPTEQLAWHLTLASILPTCLPAWL